MKEVACSEKNYRSLEKEVIVSASAKAVWRAWTTSEGAKEFFAPEAFIELRPRGRYEILFDLEALPGSRGSEGCQVVSFVPNRRLEVTWNNPPEFKDIRNSFARVVIEIEPIDPERCRVRLTHDNWGRGEQWDQTFEYFNRAWDIVLGRLVKRFSDGPIDWVSLGK